MKLLFLILLFNTPILAQVSINEGGFLAKEFSKTIALYEAKKYIIKEVLGLSDQVVQFEIDPLAASNSGELTSLVYKCETKNKEGLVLGFYGNYWNEAGVLYKGFGFKNLSKEKSIAFLARIDSAIDQNSKFLNKDNDNNNIYFQFDDMSILVSTVSNGNLFSRNIRIFWKEFDSEWDNGAFKRTKKRLLNKLD